MSVESKEHSGELRCDITRDTFHPREHFVRVLAQQGRVWLDADWNEQTAILLHYIRSLAKDIIGEYDGPKDGFVLKKSNDGKDFSIGQGHYYVDGILCENDKIDQVYSNQADYPLPKDSTLGYLAKKNCNKSGSNAEISTFLAYLDVWERHMIPQHYSDKFRSFHEVALGSADTATRSRLVWQVKLMPLNYMNCKDVQKSWKDIKYKISPGGGVLKARVEPVEITSPCPPLSGVNSSEQGNYLYRVEIHHGGQGLDISGNQEIEESVCATFKWSRMNSSIVFRITKSVEINADSIQQKSTVNLESLQCCDSSCLTPGDWVEVVDDEYTLQNRHEPLWQVMAVDKYALTADIVREIDPDPLMADYNVVGSDMSKHPLLRRWDQKETKSIENPLIGKLQYGAAIITVSEKEDHAWIPLENGIQVKFKKCPSNSNNCDSFYRTGDYWLIPARTITQGIEWPPDSSPGKGWLPPHGIGHHYAPLGIVSIDSCGNVNDDPTDVRCIILEISKCVKS